MLKKRSKLLAIVLVFAFALTGVGYAAWTDSLEVQGTVNTGNIDVQFADAWTNDQGVDPNLSASKGDVSVQFISRCPDCGEWYWWWDGHNCGDDPVDPEDPPVCRDRDDVAETLVDIIDRGEGFEGHSIENSILEVTTNNAYPGYQSEITYQLVNEGSVPVKLTGIKVNDKPGYVDVDHPEDLEMVIYPKSECNDEIYEITFTQSVNEDLSNKYMDSEFKYNIQLQFGQWNL